MSFLENLEKTGKPEARKEAIRQILKRRQEIKRQKQLEQNALRQLEQADFEILDDGKDKEQ